MTHSFPTRRSSDLLIANACGECLFGRIVKWYLIFCDERRDGRWRIKAGRFGPQEVRSVIERQRFTKLQQAINVYARHLALTDIDQQGSAGWIVVGIAIAVRRDRCCILGGAAGW